MKLATKKFFHNVLALVVSVCMVCTLTPAAAWANSGSGGDSIFVATDDNTASGETKVKGVVRNNAFAFTYISPGTNYPSKGDFVEAVGKNPLYVEMEDAGIPDDYTVEWWIQEMTPNPNFDSTKGEGEGNQEYTFGTATKISSNTYTKANTPKTNQTPTFTYPTLAASQGTNSEETQPSALTMDTNHSYKFYAYMIDKANDDKAEATTIISLSNDYPPQIILGDGEGNTAYSVQGDIYQKFSPSVSVLGVSAIGETSGPSVAINKEALNRSPNAENVESVTELTLINNDRPNGTPPYRGTLEVRIPLPDSLADAQQNSTVNVYIADGDNKVTVKEATVGWALDSEGNEIEIDGKKVPVAIVGIENTGQQLGYFGVGVPVTGTYFITTKVDGPGAITPVGDGTAKTQMPLGVTKTFAASAMVVGYEFKGFTLTVNGTSKNIPASALGYNSINLKPQDYGIQNRDNVVLTAVYTSEELGKEEQTVFGATLTCEGNASGRYTVQTVYSPGNGTPKGNQIDWTITPSSNVGSVRVDKNVGLLLTFYPTGSHVKSVTVNDKEVVFEGSTFLLSTVKENTRIAVTYAPGSQPTTGTKNITVGVQKRANGTVPATLQGVEASAGEDYTYEVNAGGVLTISAQPKKDTYYLKEVLVYSPADSTAPDDIVQHVFVSPNGSNQGTPDYSPDQIPLYNITEDMRVELVYALMDTGIEVTAPPGSWGWVIGGSTGKSGARSMRAAAASYAAPRIADNVQTGDIPPQPDGTTIWMFFREMENYELGDVKINDNRVNNLLTKREDEQGTYYSFILFVGEPGQYVPGSPSIPDLDPPDNVFYANQGNLSLKATYNPQVIMAPEFHTITTNVTSFGGGSVTPTRNVANGGDVCIEFFPDPGYKVDQVWRGTQLLAAGSNGLSSDMLSLELKNVTTDYTITVSFTGGDQQNGDKKRYSVSATAGAGGAITPGGTFPVYAGSNQTFILTPNTGYRISQVLVNDQEPGSAEGDNPQLKGNTLTINNVNADTDIRVTFRKSSATEAASYTVVAEKQGNGSITPAGSQIVGAGGNASFLLIPEEGCYVQDVRVAYGSASANSGISLMSLFDENTSTFTLADVRQDAIVRVVFGEGVHQDPDDPTSPIVKPGTEDPIPDPPGAGDVITLNPDGSKVLPASTPGAIVSPSMSEITVAKDPEDPTHGATDLTFTVTAMDGYELEEPVAGTGIVVTGTEGSSTNADITGKTTIKPVGDGVYTVTVPKQYVDANLKIEVNTRQKQATNQDFTLAEVKLRVAGEGYITPGMTQGAKEGTIQVAPGKNQTFGFVPDKDWKLHVVYVSGKPMTISGNTLTLHNIQEGTTIEAVFSKLGENEPAPVQPVLREIDVQYGPNGTVSPMNPSSGRVKVVDGSSFTLSLKPNAGYRAIAKVDGTEVPVISNAVEIPSVTKPLTTISVEFERIVDIQYRSLTVKSTGSGTTSPAGTSLVVNGTSQTVTLIPDAGMKVKSVWVTREGSPSDDQTKAVAKSTMSLSLGAITANTVVEVEFAGDLKPGDPGFELPPENASITYWDVIATAPNGGGVVTPGASKVANGGNVTLSVVPNNGYELEKLEIGGVDRTTWFDKATMSVAITNIDGPRTVVASFKKTTTSSVEDYYTVFVSASGNGTVSPMGATTVAAGGSQTITIIPDVGYKVSSIHVNDVPAGSNFGTSYTLFGITEDKHVTIIFEKLASGESGTSVLTHDIVATSSVEGRISPEGTTKVADGKNASFTFVPNDNYKLSYVRVDDNPVPASEIVNNQYIFTNVKGNHTLHAVFIPVTVDVDDFATITVGRPSNGTISPADSVLVTRGQSQQLTIAPFYGYNLTQIYVNDEPIANTQDIQLGKPASKDNASYDGAGVLTLSNIQNDMSVRASFAPVPTPSGDAPADVPTYVPIQGGTNVEPAGSNAGGSTSIGGGGYIEKPGNDATAAEKTPIVTVVPDDGSMVNEVVIGYGDGSKDVIRDDGTYKYDVNGNLVDSSGRPIDATTGGPAQIGDNGLPINPVKYPSSEAGNPKRNYPTTATPDTQEVYVNGYVTVDAERAAETGGVSVDVTFRPLDPTKSPDKEILSGAITGPTYYEINASYAGGGRMFPEGRVKVPQGQNMVFQMVPASGYELASLNVDGSSVMSKVTKDRKYVTEKVKANMTINAVFGFVNNVVNGYTVNASAKMANGDAVTGGVSPASTWAPSGSDTVLYLFPPEGTKVANVTVTQTTVTKQANGTETTETKEYMNVDNYVQPMVTVANVVSDENTDVTLDAVVTYESAPGEPTWTSKPISIEVSVPNGHGQVSPEGTIQVPVGSPQTLYFKPDEGYVVDYVLFNGLSTTLSNNPTSYTVTPSVGNDNKLDVYFKEAASMDKQFTTIQPVVVNGHATVTPRGMSVEVGSSVEFYVSPEKGYTIHSVKVDGWDITSFKPALPEGQAAQSGKDYSMYVVTIDNVQPGAKVEIETEHTGKTPIPIDTHKLTVNGENVNINPLGTINLPKGATQVITIDPLPGYYLASIMVTEKNGSDDVGAPQDIANSVVDNKLTVTMGDYDKEVYIKYQLVSGKTKPAHITLGTTKMEDGTDVNASISMRRSTEGILSPAIIDPETRMLMGGNGEPMEFDLNGVYTFYAQADAPDGSSKKLILSGAKYNGRELIVPNLTGMVADVKLTDTEGTLDLVFRELRPGEEPIVSQEYNVRFEVVGGEGSIDPYAALEGITVRLGSSTGPIKLQPASDNWMIESVTEVYHDSKGNEFGTPTVIDPRKYKDETYDCRPTCDTVVQVKFVECAIVDVKFDKSLGFVAPNPSTKYLKLPVDDVKSGVPYSFVVAPFEECYVDRFDVTPEGGQTESYLSRLQQSQSVVDYLTASGYNVADFEEGAGVAAPKLDENTEKVELMANRTFAAMANEIRASDLNPIDYNGFVPERGMTMQNAYGVQTTLDPSKTTVDIGLYTTRQATAKLYTITPSVSGEGGRISPSEPVVVRGGGSYTFNFIADKNFSLKSVLVDGSPIAAGRLDSSGTSYTFTNIDHDHTIQAEFGPITSDESSRLLRVASSLAQTGDLTGPAVGALLIVAALGLVVTGVSYIRRQQRRRRRREAMAARQG